LVFLVAFKAAIFCLSVAAGVHMIIVLSHVGAQSDNVLRPAEHALLIAATTLGACCDCFDAAYQDSAKQFLVL
jgi:hypothetical protein